jgi:hypothetical protein
VTTLNPSHRPRFAAAGFASAHAGGERHARAFGLVSALLVALAFVVAAPSAHGASGERTGGPSLPMVKANGESLTYDTFTGGSCSQAGFAVNTVAHVAIDGTIDVAGQTFLNGAPYDTYAYQDFGPDSYATDFSRPRPGDPPFGATSSSYVFVFQSVVRRSNEVLGKSVTTITCANGVLVSAANQWISNAEPIPAGHPAAWAALALLLAAAAAMRLTTRRG